PFLDLQYSFRRRNNIRINGLQLEVYVHSRGRRIAMFQKLLDTFILGACGGVFQLAVVVLRQIRRA
ncbi:MAG: hypothetical protein DMG58_16485, partial [Acidobacteria bacterium]